MVELVDTLGLGSSSAKSRGSSPLFGIKMQHSLWNMYSSIQTGVLSGKKSIICFSNPLCLSVLPILYKEGYINGFRVSPTKLGMVEIFLKYNQGKPAMRKLISPSKPGRRMYMSIKTGWKSPSSFSTQIFSTPKGLYTGKDCRRVWNGGEFLGFLL